MLGCVTRVRRVLEERLQAHGVSVARGRLLSVVVHGPVRQGVLATTFEVTPRTVTEVVDGLERDGFVERRDDPEDRRARLVHVTPAGRRANKLAAATRQDVLNEIFADLSGEQRAVLSQMLTRLSDRSTAMTQAPGSAANCPSDQSGENPTATEHDQTQRRPDRLGGKKRRAPSEAPDQHKPTIARRERPPTGISTKPAGKARD